MDNNIDALLEKFLSELPPDKRREYLLQAAIKPTVEVVRTPTRLKRQVRGLLDYFASYSDTEKFDIGDIILWKSGLKNRKFPLDGNPAIVLKVYSTPIIANNHDTSSQYFLETLDIMAGTLNEEGQMVCFHFDSRRFERLSGQWWDNFNTPS